MSLEEKETEVIVFFFANGQGEKVTIVPYI